MVGKVLACCLGSYVAVGSCTCVWLVSVCVLVSFDAGAIGYYLTEQVGIGKESSLWSNAFLRLFLRRKQTV